MRITAALIGVVLLPAAANADLRPREPAPPHTLPSPRTHRDDAPDVRLWIEHDNVFRRGERASVYFRTEHQAHVLVLRIDTDGRLDVLFPEHAYAGGYLRGDYTYRVTGRGRDAFIVDDRPGMGYVFAIASWDPFDLRSLAFAEHGDYRRTGWRIDRDPFDAIHDLTERVLYHPDTPYSLDYAEYHVNARRHYPRFLCYKCHAYRPFDVWNPYQYSCAKFRVVIYDDPHYYPYRHRKGSRVVYARSSRPGPRFELERAAGGVAVRPENFIERRRRDDPYAGRRPRGDEKRVIITDRPNRNGSGVARPEKKDGEAGTDRRRRDTEYEEQREPSYEERREPSVRRPEPAATQEDHDDEVTDPRRVEPRRDSPSRPPVARPSQHDADPDGPVSRRRRPAGG